MALSRNYTMFHGILYTTPVNDSYTVAFVEQPAFDSLDICEDKWLNNSNTQINIESMILPRVKQ